MTHPLINAKPKQDHSVVVKQPMSFGPALELIKLGASVCRWEWRSFAEHLVKYDRMIGDVHVLRIMFRSTSGEIKAQQEWLPTQEDMLAEDWFLYPIRTEEEKK